VKRALLLGLGLALVVLGGRRVLRALASDETKIRWLVEDMVDGFNDERTARAVRGLAPGFRDETSGADRDLVRQGVIRMLFQEHDPRTKRFLLRLEVPEEALAVEVAPGGDTAAARGELRLYERRGAAETLLWGASFEGDLARTDDGWRFLRSRHRTVEGERPR
jgi:hypothetical protein